MKKKLFAMALCLLMAVAMAAPVFAAEPTIYRGGQGYPPPANGSVLLLASMQNGAGYMNVYTSTTNYGTSKNVTTWSLTNADTQKWIFELRSDGYYVIKSKGNTQYSLNINTGSNNCDVVRIATNNVSDYKIKVDSEMPTNAYYSLQLPDHGNLTASVSSPISAGCNNIMWNPNVTNLPGYAKDHQVWFTMAA